MVTADKVKLFTYFQGLIKAVEEELPMVEHRMCARHVYGNLKKIHPNKPRLKKLF